MMVPAKSAAGARGLPERGAGGMLRDEGGYVLAFVMFLLAICTILGLSASQTSIDEMDIANNEVISKTVFTMAVSSLPLAAVPLIATQGRGKWTAAPVYLSDSDPTQTATSGAIQIVDGNFLYEGYDQDTTYGTGWNNWDKYYNAPDSAHKTAYKPIDDPFVPTAQLSTATGALGANNVLPDLRIRVNNLLTLDIDVDKASVAYQAGGVAEFGSGADASSGVAYQLIYVFDCKATQPGRDITKDQSTKVEAVLGYRYIP